MADPDYRDLISGLCGEIRDTVHEIADRAAYEAVREVRDMLQEALDDYDARNPAARAPARRAQDAPREEHPPRDRGFECGINGCEFASATAAGLGVHQARKHADADDDASALELVGSGLACGIDGCEYVGKNQQAVGLHRTKTHRDAATHRCEVDGCDFGCFTQRSLDVHYRRMHHGRRRYAEPDPWADPGANGVCDVKDGKCDGGVSEFSCPYERTTGCQFCARRCQYHRGDTGCKQIIGQHRRKHVAADHDAPLFD